MSLPGFAFAAGTYYVDNSNANCSDLGSGTEAQPYCHIVTALNKKGGPGTTILVKAGVYREQVTVPASGADGSQLVIQAVGTVVVDGADAFDSPAQWTQYSGDVWLAADVTWAPVQVFADGARLSPSAADPASLAPMTFQYLPGTGLYVNVGGGNPGDHQAAVGRRLNGFHLNGKSWVTIDGFTVTRAEEKGIELEAASNNCVVRNNVVNFSESSGISLLACSDDLIERNVVTDNALHGIELRDGSSACTIQDNTSAHNTGPGTTGIYLAGSADNMIQRNRTHHNEDAGIEIQTGSDNCISIQNVAYLNGDHGFEHLYAIGTTNIGNVAWKNHTDGFSVEGQSLGTALYNCIATDNGIPIHEFDFYVDSSSTAGLVSNYNIFWNSSAQNPIKYDRVQYATIAAFNGATGNDAQSIQSDPRFLDPMNGDFHVLVGSPAIDSGTSGIQYWPPFDADGSPRNDDPGTPNTGAGPMIFSDRGAYEYETTPLAVGDPTPVAAISLSGAWPNPAHGSVRFMLDLPHAARVDWSVYDVQGRRLGGGGGWQPAGRSVLDWGGSQSPGSATGGVRFARFTVDGQTFTRRFVALH